MDIGIDLEVEGLIEIPRRGTVVVGTVRSGDIRVRDVVEFRGVVATVAAIEQGRALFFEALEGDRVGILLVGCHFDIA